MDKKNYFSELAIWYIKHSLEVEGSVLWKRCPAEQTPLVTYSSFNWRPIIASKRTCSGWKLFSSSYKEFVLFFSFSKISLLNYGLVMWNQNSVNFFSLVIFTSNHRVLSSLCKSLVFPLFTEPNWSLSLLNSNTKGPVLDAFFIFLSFYSL